MEKTVTKNIRNICLLGHSGSGKTSLAEAMLYIAGGTDRLGKITEGNTVSDYDPEEIRRTFSISSSLINLTWKDMKINVLDTPGYFDFEGEVHQCIRVADAAVIVVDGKSGVQVGTELSFRQAEKQGLPKAFFINRFDDGEARFYKVFDQLREHFGIAVCPLLIPMIDGEAVTGFLNLIDFESFVYDKTDGSYVAGEIPAEFLPVAEKYRDMLYESIAQTDDALMEKYFGGEEINREEANEAIHNGIIGGDIIPVFSGAATKLWGVKTFLDCVADSFPRHTAKGEEKIIKDGEIMGLPIDKEGKETSIFVFKTIADPFVGKMSFFKVMEGELTRDVRLKNASSMTEEKIAKIVTLRGKKQQEVDTLCCGDIGVTTKLVQVNTNDTLTTREVPLPYQPITFPKPYYTLAISPASKGDEDKISTGINKLLEEDLTLKYENNHETVQMLLSGLGDTHLDIAVAKLQSRFGTSVTLSPRKIAYRETIKGKVEAEGKHKKQSGGSGQYGHVKMRFSHGEADGLTFTDSVFGGSVPKNFFPAVAKGIEDSMLKGLLAGFPMVHLHAELYDGSYHDVDSNELSFKLAAALAYKDGIPRANPVLLEPVGELRVSVPDSYIGDVMSDLNHRRGSVLGIDAAEQKGYQTVLAEVPLGEMRDYVISLRAATQGRAYFDYEVVRYADAPSNVTAKIIKEVQAT